MFVPSYNGNVLTGLASFDYESARSWLSSDRVLRFDPMKLTVSSKRLPLVRLDDCGLQPDFIKIDVQGLEVSGSCGRARDDPNVSAGHHG